jgi:hypothetical protein
VSDLTALHARLAELGITPAELAAMVSRSDSEVEEWLTADPLPADAKILTRFLADDTDALRRLHAVRHTYKQSLESDCARIAGARAPEYGGGYTGPDGVRVETPVMPLMKPSPIQPMIDVGPVKKKRPTGPVRDVGPVKKK